MSSERWKSIPNFRDYECSDQGRIRSLKSGSAQVLSLRDDKDGYKQIGLYRNGERHHRMVHRLVARCFLGEPPSPSHEVNHINCDRSDNRVENLEWCTRSENLIHSIEHGEFDAAKYARMAAKVASPQRGEANVRAKLSAESVRYARAQYAVTDISQRRLADIWGCSQTTMSKVIRKTKWQHVHVLEVNDND